MEKKMIEKKLISVLLCPLLLFGLTGCWNRREPKTLAVVLSAIYDINDEGGYKTTAELLNASSGGSSSGGIDSGGQGSGRATKVVVGEGASVPESVRGISVEAEKSIFGGHNEARFFTERFAKSEMIATLDYFARDHLTDETPLMITIKGDEPDKLYECNPRSSSSIGEYMSNLANSYPKVISQGVFVTTLDFMKDYYTEGKEPVTGVVEIKESETEEESPSEKEDKSSDEKSQYEMVYQGLAVYRDGQLVGYLDATGTEVYNYITNHIRSTFVSVPAGDGISVLGINHSKAVIKASLEDGEITFDLKIKLNADIIQETGTLDVSKISVVKEIEQIVNRHMEATISQTVELVQTQFGSDIFGFGAQLHMQQPKQWKNLKDTWNETFSQSVIIVTVECAVSRTGDIKQPIKLEE